MPADRAIGEESVRRFGSGRREARPQRSGSGEVAADRGYGAKFRRRPPAWGDEGIPFAVGGGLVRFWRSTAMERRYRTCTRRAVSRLRRSIAGTVSDATEPLSFPTAKRGSSRLRVPEFRVPAPDSRRSEAQIRITISDHGSLVRRLTFGVWLERFRPRLESRDSSFRDSPSGVW